MKINDAVFSSTEGKIIMESSLTYEILDLKLEEFEFRILQSAYNVIK